MQVPFDDYFGGTDEAYPVHLIFTDRTGEKFMELGEPVDLPKNYLLYNAGDVPDCCYYIRRGRVMAFEYTSSGEERIYNLNEEGSLIFEPSVILSHKLTLSFKTLVSSTLVRISRDVLLGAVASDPKIATELLCSVSEKFIEVNEQIRESATHSVHWKVCNLLLTYAYKFGVQRAGRVFIYEKISQQMMANLLRVNRVTVTRVISDLKDSGLLEQADGHYCICDLEKMRRHMQSIDAGFNVRRE